MEVPSIKVTSQDNGQLIAWTSRGTNFTSGNKTEGNSTTTPYSTALAPALHSNSTNNSTSANIKNNSNKIATSSNLSAKLTQSPSTSKSTFNYNYNNSAKPLSISIQSSQNIVNGRGTSTITAIAYDGTTGKEIKNAVVRIKITFTSNSTSKEIVGHNGQVTYSVQIKPNSKNNSDIGFRTAILASAPGYISTSKTSSSYSSASTMTYLGSQQEEEEQSIINKNGSGELPQNILKNVQKKLEQNGIDFALGK